MFIDGTCLKRSGGGSCESVGLLVAVGVDEEGRREIIGCAEGFTESKDLWKNLLRPEGRGLASVRMAASARARWAL